MSNLILTKKNEFYYFSILREIINCHFLMKLVYNLLENKYYFGAQLTSFLDSKALKNFVKSKNTDEIEIKNYYEEMEKKTIDELYDNFEKVLNKLSHFIIKI